MTFTDARSRLGDWVGANTVRFPNTVRGHCINMARRAVSRLHDSRYNEVSGTFATVVSTRSYALPARWSRPHTLWYTDPDNASQVYLDYLDRQTFDINFPDATKTGDPTAYTVWGGNMLLGKTPSRVFTVNRNYYEILADLSADADTDALMDENWELVHYKALVEATAYLVDDARVGLWKAKADELELQFVIEHVRGRSAGRRAESVEP